MVLQMNLDSGEDLVNIGSGKRRSDVDPQDLNIGGQHQKKRRTEGEDRPPSLEIKYRRVLRNIPDIPYMPIQLESGKRVYLRLLANEKRLGGAAKDEIDLKDIVADAELLNSKSKEQTKTNQKRTLIADWDRVKAEARLLKDKFHRTLAKVVEAENVVEGLLGDRTKIEDGETKREDDALWVEKYKPKSYFDLLSEENINRALLHWLKLWDKTVFGNDYLAKFKATKEKYAGLDAKEKEKAEKLKKGKFHLKQATLEVEEEYDETNRPKMKVALLHGPPGLGKTTCAHIIGKHAGYNVREMNASDDRSVDIFKKFIDDVTQSKSEIFQDGKPNCLVIDEIDGAPAATVQVLVDLISGSATETGKKKAKKTLRRPIICICNDLYAPSLKLLKKHAMVLQFPPVTPSSLADRLHDISIKEKLNLDNGTIVSLVDKSESDIRSCLSTLQFLKKKKCTNKDALFAQIGMKDKSKGLFAVWQDVFTIPNCKKYHAIEDPTKPDVRFRSVLRVAQNYGEYEKLQSGVFENYLRMKTSDSYLQSVLDGLSWSTWFEDIKNSIDSHQNYVLMGYLPLYFVQSHFLFAQRGWVKINNPSNDRYLRTQHCQNILKGQCSDVSPSVGRYSNQPSLVTDVYPFLLPIIQPTTIRPVPTQLWSKAERETLKNIVEVMIAYNLSYTQMKDNETGSYNFVLEPNIQDLIKYKFHEQVASKTSFPYAVMQLVAREIEMEKLRLSDFNTNVESSSRKDNQESTSTAKTASNLPDANFKVPHVVEKKSSVVTTLTPKPHMIGPPSMAKDFFGRPIAPSAESTQEMLALQRRSSGIYYRFKEGYSNAVRRQVKMKDLI